MAISTSYNREQLRLTQLLVVCLIRSGPSIHSTYFRPEAMTRFLNSLDGFGLATMTMAIGLSASNSWSISDLSTGQYESPAKMQCDNLRALRTHFA